MILFIEGLVWLTVITKIGINIDKFFIAIIGLIISILNYYIFLQDDRWKLYKKEFESKPELATKKWTKS